MDKDDICENIIDLMSTIFAENIELDGLEANEPEHDEELGEK